MRTCFALAPAPAVIPLFCSELPHWGYRLPSELAHGDPSWHEDYRTCDQGETRQRADRLRADFGHSPDAGIWAQLKRELRWHCFEHSDEQDENGDDVCTGVRIRPEDRDQEVVQDIARDMMALLWARKAGV